jgi:hypothetical protein
VFGNLCTQVPAGSRDAIAPAVTNGSFERRETPAL